MTRQYEALIIDFGGVLTSDLFDAMRSFAVREGLPRESVVDLLTNDPEGKNALAALERGDLTQRSFEVTVSELLGVNHDDLVPRILADLKPDALMLETVDRIKTSGYRVVVLSNTWGLEPYDPYEPYDLTSRADAVVYSESVRLRKPDVEIFRVAVGLAGVEATSCVFVDDIAHNLDPARALGMSAIHHTSSSSTIRQLTETYFPHAR